MSQADISGGLDDRAPTIQFSRKKSAKTDHESRHSADNMLSDRHVDPNHYPTNGTLAIVDRGPAEVVPLDEVAKVVCPRSIRRLEGKFNFPGDRKDVAILVIPSEKFIIGDRIFVQQIKD